MLKNKYIPTSYVNGSRSGFRSSETDVLSLIKRNRLEEKQLKRKNILLAAGAISALAISGLLISL